MDSNEIFSLKNKKALVTGSSRGIGRAIAIRLAEFGADVAVHYAGQKESAEAVCDRIAQMGRRTIAVQSDLCDISCADEIAGKIGKGFCMPDILVLNASVQIRRPWQDITPQEFEEQIDCNLRSSLLLMQKFVPDMRQKHWGRVVVIGSVQERRPHPDMLVYAAGKAAQSNMVRSLAKQLAADGVTVNSVAPGVILTDRNTDALANAAYRAGVVNGIPAGYCGEPEDCAGIVVLLCSEAGRYITGQNIFVDGGMGIS